MRRDPNIITGSNHRAAAEWNRKLVLRLLRHGPPLSRLQISERVGLQNATLSKIVRDYLDAGVLRVAGKADSRSAGPKQILLEIEPSYGWTAGVSLRPETAQIVIADAAGGRLGDTRVPVRGSLESIPAQIRRGLDRWFARAGRPPGIPLGVGLGVTGVVDADLGVVLASSAFAARNVPLRQFLAEHFDGACVIDHDACFGALAEAAEGAARDVETFVYLTVNHRQEAAGVRFRSFGAALFLDGRVYRGAHYAAGELDPILAPASDFVADDADLSALRHPDAPMTPGLDRFAGSLAQSLGLIVNLMDLPLVVIGGNADIVNKAFLHAVAERVRADLIPIPGRSVELTASTLPSDAVARGAAIAAADAALESGRMSSAAAAAPIPAPAVEREVSP